MAPNPKDVEWLSDGGDQEVIGSGPGSGRCPPPPPKSQGVIKTDMSYGCMVDLWQWNIIVLFLPPFLS